MYERGEEEEKLSSGSRHRDKKPNDCLQKRCGGNFSSKQSQRNARVGGICVFVGGKWMIYFVQRGFLVTFVIDVEGVVTWFEIEIV